MKQTNAKNKFTGKNKKLIWIIAAVIVVVGVGAYAAMHDKKEEPPVAETTVTQVPPAAVPAETPAPVTNKAKDADKEEAKSETPKKEAKPLKGDKFSAECMMKDGSVIMGQAKAVKGAAPVHEEELELVNPNNGKVNKVKQADAHCTFTAIK